MATPAVLSGMIMGGAAAAAAAAARGGAFVPRRPAPAALPTSSTTYRRPLPPPLVGPAPPRRRRPSPPPRMIYAPPGSGYADREDETDYYPDTYEPMMEYPGTMRPGRVSENQAYENLPCGDADPDPVPWPNFQEIEWHHLWEPPHPHPEPMEEFIERHGRWATVEEEAQMRMDVRRGVRERRELEELEKAGASTLIVDEDEDDEEEERAQLELGRGVEGLMSAAEEATKERGATEEKVDEGEEEEEEGEVDFLLDLGLDAAEEDADDAAGGTGVAAGDGDLDGGDEPAFATGGGSPEDLLSAMRSMIDMEEGEAEGEGGAGPALVDAVEDDDDDDIDLDIDLGLLDDDVDVGGPANAGADDVDIEEDEDEGDDDMGITMIGDDGGFGGGNEDMGGGFQTIPLDEFSSNEDMGDDEGFFDDGGFDYD